MDILELTKNPETRQKEFQWLLHNDAIVYRLNKELSSIGELTQEARLVIMLIATREQFRRVIHRANQ